MTFADTQISNACTRFEAGQAKLQRGDGTAMYAPQEMRERTAALLAAFDAELAPVLERADTDLAAAQRQLAVLQGADPLDRLSSAQLAEAGQRRAFVTEDAELPPERLAARVRAVIAASDTVGMALFHRALDRRFERLRAVTARRGHSSPGQAGELSAVRVLLDELAAATADPNAEAKREAAEAAVAAATAVRWDVARVRREIDGTHAALQARSLASARALF